MRSKRKTQRFSRLISHGYFAPELPPCFVTLRLAKYRESIWREISGRIANYTSEPCWFYFPRFGRNDRKFGIINPISYLAIAHVISDNFIQLKKSAQQSRFSASPPEFDWNGSRAALRPNINVRDDFQVNLLNTCDRFASADIQSFFHSIYTHAIPWAILGKSVAKSNRSDDQFSNKLDRYCRNAQDGQTIGLPVGPDTSRFIAEIVASGVDKELQRRLKTLNKRALRYVDDYLIGVGTGQSGDEIIAAIRQAASFFELELNSDKSEIHSKSFRFPIGWKQAVVAARPKKSESINDFYQFFYQIGRISDEQPNINVEKYALQNARLSFVDADNWKTIQNYLLNAYWRNPTLISFLVEILVLRQRKCRDVNINGIREFLDRCLPQLALENRTGEITWLLYLIIKLRIKIPASRIEPLFDMVNALVALLVCYASKNNYIEGAIKHNKWDSFFNKEGLKGQMWLYAYESVVQDVNPAGSSRFIEEDYFFKSLYKRKVSFFLRKLGLMKSITSPKCGKRKMKKKESYVKGFVKTGRLNWMDTTTRRITLNFMIEGNGSSGLSLAWGL